MSERINRSVRVVIMDDVSWSEPTPRSRSVVIDMDSLSRRPSRTGSRAPEPVRRPQVRESASAEVATPRFRAADYLGGNPEDWTASAPAEPALIEYTDALDEEEIWGPRPKLLSSEPGGRRTVVITGRVTDHHLAPRAATRSNAIHARESFQADRTAMWAVLLCVMLLLAAVVSH